MGKSCLLLRFADDTFTESYISTIGVDFVSLFLIFYVIFLFEYWYFSLIILLFWFYFVLNFIENSYH